MSIEFLSNQVVILICFELKMNNEAKVVIIIPKMAQLSSEVLII